MSNEPDPQRRGLCLVVAAPSGGGKTSVVRRLVAEDPAVTLSISMTTRPIRAGEMEGRDYFYTDRPGFESAVGRGDLLEHAEIFGNYYGTPRAPVEAALAAGRDVAFDIDWQGCRQLQASMPGDVVAVFLIAPDAAVLESRLRARGRDPEAAIQRRLADAAAEIAQIGLFDYVLINDGFEACVGAVRGILEAERLRRVRRPDLVAAAERLRRQLLAQGLVAGSAG